MSVVQHPITLPAGGEQSRAQRPAKHRFDVLVVGAGAVGMSVAYGLAQRGLSVCVADEGDIAFKASRGNFGLAWVQGKGAKCDDYAHWSIDAAGMWPGFAAKLQQTAGIDVELSQPGGFVICASAQEYEVRIGMLTGMQHRLGGKFAFEALSGPETQARMPQVSAQIAGSTYCPLDGHVSPLKLLRALFTAFSGCGGVLCPHTAVQSLNARPQGGFSVRTATGTIDADKVVLAAGLGSTALASRLGLDAPLHPVRGQLLITERAEPFLCYPTLHVRQTADGTVQIGDSKEDVGLDTGTSWDVLARIAKRALRSFPALAGLSMVRGWGALRVMSPDGFPIYDESLQHPGAFLVTCHSGITLAPQHAGPIAEWIATGERPDGISGFSARRFHV
ncbi:FAD-binding oxidoreductase [Acidovorax sp. NCPPB 3859]|nr:MULTISPECIES: FAD-dependent oxidoreductase [unclassified Acidovorax]MDA8453057.1 FAD-binding oxidoreductase [Acidovorax sp. GBBC 3297]MDA8462468.1 FAD-binding oxidoreductase [Acidovorax sp. GBBC 3333]MDA8467499.1 FAD-binding oxidoreductase [Acidovorax sp. GBBC 3332]MDA8472533.1 FAD-binding oxidoreductase [Acidovorax sp. GBBC 3299]WCM80344.1 FAD-binding oxidoreductase [Acidovorax sp. GBBC 712]